MKRTLPLVLILLGAGYGLLKYHPPALQLVEPWLPAKAKELLAANAQPKEPKAAPAGKSGRSGPPPAPVTADIVVRRDMPIILTAPGTVEAEASVAIKSRVDGQIAEISFREGDLVKKGQILFKLDDRLIRAQIKQAEAAIKKDEAALADAQATLGRRNALVDKKIVSEAAMDTAKASVNSLKASIAAGQAALDAQKTQLDYLTIPAPITGRTGSSSVKPGSNVRAADAAALVTINQTQPIAVSFAVPQTELAAMRRALSAGALAKVTASGTIPIVREGQIDFIDNQVNTQTGTLTGKLEIANADEALWPGLAVEVALSVETKPQMLSVPASAVIPSQQGMIVWVIGADNKVTPRPVVLDRIVEQTAFLTEGVSAGDRVVTDGHVRIAPGSTVSVQEPPSKRDPSAPKAEAPNADPKDIPKVQEKKKGERQNKS